MDCRSAGLESIPWLFGDAGTSAALAAPSHGAAFRDLPAGRSNGEVALAAEVSALLARDCVVAVGVSGGKDSDACAIAVDRHLRTIGHSGPRLLVHSDLGRVEWRDSLPSCERLAKHLGWELVVVKRQAGDMLARWQVRWANNVARYRDLECVKLILPWSTPSWRFCTSELKANLIASALKKRFPDRDIVNVVGIRRQESAGRRRMPVATAMPQLVRRGHAGLTWNAIIEWPVEDVLATIAAEGLALHEAYVRYGSSRVSCAFCIMSSMADLQAAIGCPDNHGIYRAMVALEAESTFAFQGGRWLGDLAPDKLSDDLRSRLAAAKSKAAAREAIEAEIPRELLYERGWPRAVPTLEEAELLASVRRRVAEIVRVTVAFQTGAEVQQRFRQLLDDRAARVAR